MSDFSSRRIESRRQNNARFFERNSPRNSYSHQNPQSKKWIFIVGILVIFFALYSHVSGTRNIIIPAGDFTITSGETIGSLNESQKFGISSWRYKMYIKFFAPTPTLKAGTYATTEDLPLEKFLQTAFKETKVVSNEQQIKILPGWNIWDIDAYLAENNILNAGDFEKAAKEKFAKFQSEYKFLAGAKSLEGFLMPDTYRIFKNSSAENIITKLLDNFEAKIAKDYNSLDAKTAYQKLILASIVEREERRADNRPIVAGILEKRVKEGIAMGADATVCYGFQKTFKECTPSFIASVITDHSNIYNTRKTLGYPPTPISGVSVSAWNAAFKPENSSYYYYLHDNDGAIHYATTLAEHNANVQKYLR